MATSRLTLRADPSLTQMKSIPQHSDPLEKSSAMDRASVDISRRPSPWVVSDTSQNSYSPANSRTPSTPISRPQPLPSLLRQRPSSMVSLSPSRSLPTVAINSPGSPPKSHNLFKPNLASNAPSQSPVPPKRPQSHYARSAHSPLPSGQSPTREPGQDSPSIGKSDGHSVAIQQNLVRPPPQINRLEKPRIPIKPASVIRSSNLEPETIRVDERLSPFNTPPSSDENAELISHKSSNMQSKLRLQKSAMNQRQSYFPGLSEHHPLHSLRQDSDSIPAQANNGLESRLSKSPATESIPSHHLDTPPGLPPRASIKKVSQRPAVSTPMVSKSTRREYKDAAAKSIPTASIRNLNASNDYTKANAEFLPPPRRNTKLKHSSSLTADTQTAVLSTCSSQVLPVTRDRHDIDKPEFHAAEFRSPPIDPIDFPDTSSSNRRAPSLKSGIREIETHYDTRLLGMCGPYVCTTGYLTRAWDLSSGKMIMSLGQIEKELRITAMAFKPGTTADEDGSRLWLGNNYGDIQEVDISTQKIVSARSGAHGRREIVKIHRHQNSMWTLDEDGKLYVWPPDGKGSPSLQSMPTSYRVPKGHTFSLIVKENLWLATGKDIRIFRPGTMMDQPFSVLEHPLGQPGVSEVTSGAILSGQLDRVYFGHADGKVTMYSTVDHACLGVVQVSVYKISSLAGAGSYLWAGYNTGMIYVYDTRTQPWTTKKEWLAHDHPIADIVADSSSVWTSGLVRVASIGQDNAIRLWDGLLEDDWLGTSTRFLAMFHTIANMFSEDDLQDHDTDYCSFREIKAVVVTWNVGAIGPANVRYEEKGSNFFNEVLQTHEPPDLLVFGFQELVDLEDKRLTASTSSVSTCSNLSDNQQRAFSRVAKGRILQSMNT